MKTFMVYGKTVELSDNIIQLYETVYNDTFTDVALNYYSGEAFGCTPDLSASELKEKIENGIREEAGILVDMPQAIDKAKRDGIIPL